MTTVPGDKQMEAAAVGINHIFAFLGREVEIGPHRKWGGTTCPGDRWRGWVPTLAVIAQEFRQEDDNMMKMRFVKGPEGPEWATDGVHRIGVTGQVKTDLINLGLAEPGDALPVTQAFINSLIDHAADIKFLKTAIDEVSGGGTACKGATPKQVKEQSKQAAREGTG